MLCRLCYARLGGVDAGCQYRKSYLTVVQYPHPQFNFA
jgi:hypothetical protein